MEKDVNNLQPRHPHSVRNITETKEQPADGENSDKTVENKEWSNLLLSLSLMDYHQACVAVVRFFDVHFGIDDIVLLDYSQNRFIPVSASGSLIEESARFAISQSASSIFARFEHLFKLAALKHTSTRISAPPSNKIKYVDWEKFLAVKRAAESIHLFPLAAGGVTSGILAVSGNFKDTPPASRERIARFAAHVILELEVIRLRSEVERSRLLVTAINDFNKSLSNIDDENFLLDVTRISLALLQSGRGSLLSFDQSSQRFAIQAAVGIGAERFERLNIDAGEKIAGKALHEARPLLVRDVRSTAGIKPSPASRGYKTNSFISYPIKVGGQIIGILNITDKIDGGEYSACDLELLEAFAPQLAIALDRTVLKKKAGELEQLSITDPLTGLLNRRYLEVRLAEEINGLSRHDYWLSFLMIDVDDFKSYNDTFSHPEGDKALKLIAHTLKENLRGADVATRYGGEEFSVLLPQTDINEAILTAERIRSAVEKIAVLNRKVTVSIGVAACSKELCSAALLVSTADRSLYEAKRAGRNSIRANNIV